MIRDCGTLRPAQGSPTTVSAEVPPGGEAGTTQGTGEIVVAHDVAFAADRATPEYQHRSEAGRPRQPESVERDRDGLSRPDGYFDRAGMSQWLTVSPAMLEQSRVRDSNPLCRGESPAAYP